MRLAGAAGRDFLERPEERFAAALLWGGEASEVTQARDRLRRALLGDGGDGALRETRIAAADARREPVIVSDALKSFGFFGGRPLVVVEAATDATTDALGAALATAAPGDGFLLVTAGALPGRSRLRKLFEEARNAAAIGIQGVAMDRRTLAALALEEGCEAEAEALDILETLRPELDGAALADLARRAALHARAEDADRMTAADVEACVPVALSGEAERIADDVLLGRLRGFGGRLRRIEAQGVAAGAVASATSRRLRLLHGKLTGAGGARPLYGPAGETVEAASGAWTAEGAERALAEMQGAERALRSSPAVSPYALLERSLVRIAAAARGARARS